MSKNTITTIEQYTHGDQIYFYITRKHHNPEAKYTGNKRVYTWNVDNSLRPISLASVSRLQCVLNSKHVTLSDYHLGDYATRLTFTPNGTMPTRYGEYGPFTLKENWYGNLEITMSEDERKALQDELAEDEFEYPQIDEILYDVFNGTGLEYNDGIYEGSTPYIIDRVEYAEDDPKYNPMGGDDNTNFEESKVWGYDSWMIRHFLQELADKGSVTLRLLD